MLAPTSVSGEISAACIEFTDILEVTFNLYGGLAMRTEVLFIIANFNGSTPMGQIWSILEALGGSMSTLLSKPGLCCTQEAWKD